MIGIIFSTVNALVVVITSFSDHINFKDEMSFKFINFIITDDITILYFYRFFIKSKINPIFYEIKKIKN